MRPIRIPARLAAVLAAAALLAAGAAIAQDDAADKSRFVRFLESMLSTPERQVSITDLQGAFSSNPSVGSIVVTDAEGPWLRLDGVAVEWNRSALFRRVLDINSLRAERVALLRRPAPGEAPQQEGEASGLPVEIQLDRFALPEIVLGAPLLGREARLSAEGSARIGGEVVAAQLQMQRLDSPGSFSADLRFQPQDNVLDADLRVAEPEGGLLAEWLGLQGRPSVALAVEGSGPLDSWRADLEMRADDARVLAGIVAVTRVEDGYRIAGDLGATLQDIAPPGYAALLAGDSRLAFNVLRTAGGGIEVEAASLRSQGVDLSARGALSADLVPTRAELSLALGAAGRTVLPFVPGEVSVAALNVSASLDEGAQAPWQADLTASGIDSRYGGAAEVALSAAGEAGDLAVPASRSTSFRIEGTAGGLAATDPALAEALGTSLRLTGAGTWSAGQPVRFDSLQAILAGATASFAGSATGAGLDGRFSAGATDLGRFARLAARPLSGSAQLQADGSVAFAGMDLDLSLQGAATDLGTGVARLDGLLAGTTRIEGGVAREDGDLRFEALTLANPQVNARLDGSYAASALDLSVDAGVTDLAALTPRASGQATLSVRVTGSTDAPRVEAEASGEDLMLMQRAFTDASVRFAGTVAGPQTEGEAELSGNLAGTPVRGSARLAAGTDGARLIEGLLVEVGESRAAGELAIAADGLLTGDLSLVSPDISKVAPLLLVEATGMLRAEVVMAAEDGGQSARIEATATDITYEGISLDSAEIAATGEDLFSTPQLDGSFTLRNLATGGLTIVSATGEARRARQSTAFSVQAELADGSAEAVGSLEPRGEALAVALQSFSFVRPGVDLRLAEATSIVVENGTARFDAARIDVSGGFVTVDGAAGRDLDLRVQLESVPAALVNSFAAGLAAEGTISGTATVTGSAAAPVAQYDLDWEGASVAASRNAGLGPLRIAAEGGLAGQSLRIDSDITGQDGLALRLQGSVGTGAGAPLDLALEGTVPLSLGNAQLAARGAALQGALGIDIAIGGTAGDPQFSGRVTSAGGGFVDPATGIVLRDLTLEAAVATDRIVVERLTAASGDGSVSVSGAIGLDPGQGFPLDLEASVRQARYVDGTLVAARFDADLQLTGSLAQGPLLGGRVFIDRAEITVPEQLPGDSIAVEVEHVAPPADVQRTLALVREGSGSGRGGEGGSGGSMRLDLTLDAPQQIFIRGRGLDAEVGGSLRITGPVSAIVADGAFEMRRGRLDIFTQRITFERGIVTFAGDLDPILDFAGTTESQDITVTVSVSGRASDPEVIFSSIPELPQDEVLAHLIFNKGIAELSPVQIARLAAAAAQLTGAGSGGLLESLRASTGLDDLDIVTDEEGAPALAAGRYISENVYLGVQQSTSGESRVSIDLDITENLKARGAVSPQGNSSLGIFFEREY